MNSGIHLTLLVGSAVPVLAPPPVIEALTSVEVTSSTDRSGFQLQFSMGKTSLLQTTLLPSGYFDPIVTRVIVIATVRGLPHVLMDGIVTRQEVSPGSEPGASTLAVTGEDLSVLMDLVEMPFMRFPAQPIIARVYAILAKYAAFGIAPIAVPPIIPDIPNVLEEIPHQEGTDREYLKNLAADCGYVFFVEPGPAPGGNIAYFGPDVRIPAPQPALTLNMDAETNVEALTFSLDGLAKKIVVMTVMDPVSRRTPIPIPVPNVSILRPPMGARLPLPSRVEFPGYGTELSLPDAANKILGVMFNASDAVTGSGSLDVLRYGHVLRARMMVGVRGAGLAYDGFYYVNSVTHSLRRGEYKQSFSLSRDGLVSNTPMVPA
jgi:hypothetical protein